MRSSAASPPVVALVANNEALLGTEAADTLEEVGLKVLEVSSADAALSYLEEENGVGLLFTDVNMPGHLNGFDLAREVAASWPEILILVCSGATRPQPGELPVKARLVDKPYSSSLLHRILREMRTG